MTEFTLKTEFTVKEVTVLRFVTFFNEVLCQIKFLTYLPYYAFPKYST